MRKFLSVLLVMAVAMVSVFAVTGDKLWITSSVAAVKPEYTMYGATSALNLSDLTGAAVAGESKAAATTLEGGAINANDINVYIAVMQNNAATYKSTTGFTLTVTAGNLTGENGGSVSPSVEAYDGDTPSGEDGTGADFQSVVASHTAPSVTYTVKYPTGVPVAAGALVGTCQFMYAHNASLPVGAYQATIEMLYEAP